MQEGEPYLFDMGGGFVPARRDIGFLNCSEAAIRPLIERLTFIKSKKNWAYPFRFGILEIPDADFLLIAEAMGVDASALPSG